MKTARLTMVVAKGFSGACCTGLGVMGFLLAGHRNDLLGVAVLTGLTGAGLTLIGQAGQELAEVVRGS